MTATDAQELRRVLLGCRAAELAMAALYAALADLHAHAPEIARLWRKTAREEENHAAQFSLLIDGIPHSIQASALDVQTLDDLCSTVAATADEYRRRSPSVRDALAAMIAREETLDRIHAHQAMVFTDSRHQRMFAAMMAADADHVAELRRALNKL
jgi:rubrerythrin